MRPDARRLNEILGFIGANVRRLRLERGWTQSHLAGFAGQDLTALQRVERGETNLTVGVLVCIADALEVAPGTLLRPATLSRAKRGRPRRAARFAGRPPPANAAKGRKRGR